MDVLRIYQDFGVDHATEGHKHCRDGWVNTACPHCSGNEGLHLGWNIFEEYYRCWRCGWHAPIKTLSLILNLSENEVRQTVKSYGILRSDVKKKTIIKQELKFPSSMTKLKDRHKAYLKAREFNPDKLAKIWGLKGTGPLSYLETKDRIVDYRLRIIIPFEWNADFVTFDARDITNQQPEKYKACPIEMEKYEHKKIVYGKQEAWSDTIICVEGPSDAWRLGPENAIATSGIEYTPEQVRVIANSFKKVIVMFDDDPQAIRNGRRLVKDLQFRGIESYQHNIKGDPGSMDQKSADKLVRKLLNK